MVLMMHVRVKQDFSHSFYLSDLGDNLTFWGSAKNYSYAWTTGSQPPWTIFNLGNRTVRLWFSPEEVDDNSIYRRGQARRRLGRKRCGFSWWWDKRKSIQGTLSGARPRIFISTCHCAVNIRGSASSARHDKSEVELSELRTCSTQIEI